MSRLLLRHRILFIVDPLRGPLVTYTELYTVYYYTAETHVFVRVSHFSRFMFVKLVYCKLTELCLCNLNVPKDEMRLPRTWCARDGRAFASTRQGNFPRARLCAKSPVSITCFVVFFCTVRYSHGILPLCPRDRERLKSQSEKESLNNDTSLFFVSQANKWSERGGSTR